MSHDTVLQPYTSSQLNTLLMLLAPLKKFYPGFDDWLPYKVSEPGTTVTVAMNNEKIIGVVIGFLKSPSRYKIATVYVHPDYRNQKIGVKLMDSIINTGLKTDTVKEMFLTSDESLLGSLGEFVSSLFQFSPVHAVANRYIPGNTEVYYVRQFL